MIIVTGGAGFIGSCFVEKLNSEGINDIIIVDSLGHDEKWRNLNGRRFFDYYHKDHFISLVEKDGLNITVEAVIHMGACSSTVERNAEYLMTNNYRYTKILADWALTNNARFIYASSAATYGDGSAGYSDNEIILPTFRPLNLYGFSKHAFDLCALETTALKKIAGLKFFNVYGPHEHHKGDQASVVYKGFNSIQKTGSIKLFKSHNDKFKDGEFYRDFVYVKDCVEVMWWFLQNPNINGIYNLGSGKASSWNDLANAIFEALSLDPKIEYVDMPEAIRSQYQYHTEAPMAKLKKAGCPVEFHSIKEGVKDYVDYLLPD